MNILTFLVFLVVADVFAATAEDFLSIEETAKLPIKRLKAILTDRGLECKGCTEKDEFVRMVFDAQSSRKEEHVKSATEEILKIPNKESDSMSAAGSSDTSDEPSKNVDISAPLSMDDIRRLPIKRIKKMLQVKGVECKGCSEKEDYVKLAFESQSLVSSTTDTASSLRDPLKTEKAATAEGEKMDKGKLDELMASLKKGGFGNSKLFTADDLKGRSPEELGDMLNTGGKGSKSSKKSSSSKNKKTTSEKKTSSAKTTPKKETDTTKKRPVDVRAAAPTNAMDSLEDDGETIEL